MESESIKVNIDEQTELAFDVKIQGESDVVPKFRLVCEAPDVSMAFPGHGSTDDMATDGTFTVNVRVPKMMGRLKEGSYDTQLEVILGDRVFVPLKMRVDFAMPLKVEATKSKDRVIETTHVTAKVIPVTRPKKEAIIESPKPEASKRPPVTKKHMTLREQYDALRKK